DGTPAPSETPALTPARAPRDAIHRIWPDFTTRALITRSIIATKCLAVPRAFDGTGRDVTWAVMDSGIDGGHAHFATHGNLENHLHRSFRGDGHCPPVDYTGHSI